MLPELPEEEVSPEEVKTEAVLRYASGDRVIVEIPRAQIGSNGSVPEEISRDGVRFRFNRQMGSHLYVYAEKSAV